jgi:hypothetical protein
LKIASSTQAKEKNKLRSREIRIKWTQTRSETSRNSARR